MARINRWLIDRLRRDASRDAVLIHLQDGTVKAFDKTVAERELYLLIYDRAIGREPHVSEFVEALANATPESRRAVMAHAEGEFYEDVNEHIRERSSLGHAEAEDLTET